ncbi:MAG: EF-hand domain-containing protein [Desulfovibrionaceae bacterium]|nr:EF-hand domain-containing protein [Desulfovibrionaceae bacterium]
MRILPVLLFVPGLMLLSSLHSFADDRFAAMDADGNGNVSREEFRKACPGIQDRAFDVIDANHDGQISEPEWTAFKSGHRTTDMKKNSGVASDMPLVMPPTAK